MIHRPNQFLMIFSKKLTIPLKKMSGSSKRKRRSWKRMSSWYLLRTLPLRFPQWDRPERPQSSKTINCKDGRSTSKIHWREASQDPSISEPFSWKRGKLQPTVHTWWMIRENWLFTVPSRWFSTTPWSLLSTCRKENLSDSEERSILWSIIIINHQSVFGAETSVDASHDVDFVEGDGGRGRWQDQCTHSFEASSVFYQTFWFSEGWRVFNVGMDGLEHTIYSLFLEAVWFPVDFVVEDWRFREFLFLCGDRGTF